MVLHSLGVIEGDSAFLRAEVRFGIVNSALWATATTSASNGLVNSMHDSFTSHRRPGAHVADTARRARVTRSERSEGSP